VIAAVLLLAGLAVWIGCIGFARLRTPLDRLHAASFAAAAAGPLVALAAFLADGDSIRAWKILLAVVLLVGNGAATTHALARCVVWRDASETPP
jgi:multicomponent Na+:H+ antiporter subunit G